MVSHGLGLLVWFANLSNGWHNGSDMHAFWMWTTRFFSIAPVLTVIFSIIAYSSYGTKG